MNETLQDLWESWKGLDDQAKRNIIGTGAGALGGTALGGMSRGFGGALAGGLAGGALGYGVSNWERLRDAVFSGEDLDRPDPEGSTRNADPAARAEYESGPIGLETGFDFQPKPVPGQYGLEKAPAPVPGELPENPFADPGRPRNPMLQPYPVGP